MSILSNGKQAKTTSRQKQANGKEHLSIVLGLQCKLAEETHKGNYQPGILFSSGLQHKFVHRLRGTGKSGITLPNYCDTVRYNKITLVFLYFRDCKILSFRDATHTTAANFTLQN